MMMVVLMGNCVSDTKGDDEGDDGERQTESVAGDLAKCMKVPRWI